MQYRQVRHGCALRRPASNEIGGLSSVHVDESLLSQGQMKIRHEMYCNQE